MIAEDAMGICPNCKEWTSPNDSCCGEGAYVDGMLRRDQSDDDDEVEVLE